MEAAVRSRVLLRGIMGLLDLFFKGLGLGWEEVEVEVEEETRHWVVAGERNL